MGGPVGGRSRSPRFRRPFRRAAGPGLRRALAGCGDGGSPAAASRRPARLLAAGGPATVTNCTQLFSVKFSSKFKLQAPSLSPPHYNLKPLILPPPPPYQYTWAQLEEEALLSLQALHSRRGPPANLLRRLLQVPSDPDGHGFSSDQTEHCCEWGWLCAAEAAARDLWHTLAEEEDLETALTAQARGALPAPQVGSKFTP